MTFTSPLANPDVRRRLIKPSSIALINDLAACLVEERERLEDELINSYTVPAEQLRGLAYAANRLRVVEQRFQKVLQEFDKGEGSDD